jgi:hypothetical protein
MLSFGQLFGSNFWSSFKSQPSESIEKLLSKSDCRIEELLDDSDLLQECKNSNKNLVKYLDREKIKQLIDFITVMPEEDEHKRGHKYPFLANEVFSCDMTEVLEKFFLPPSEDAQDEPEEGAEDEDGTKFESGFEKDNEDSNSDSEEEEYGNEDDDHEEPTKTEDTQNEDQPAEKANDQNLKVEDFEEEKTHEVEKESTEQKESETKEEGQADKPVELSVEDEIQEKNLEQQENQPKESEETKAEDNSNVSSSPSTGENKEEQKQTSEEAQKETSENQPALSSQEAASPPTESLEAQNETPAAEEKEKEEPNVQAEEQIEDQTTAESTLISEATSETTTTTKGAQKKPLNTNKYDLLDYLTRFIDTDNELNDVLAGYFARLCNILIQKKSDEIVKYFFTKEHLLYKFAYHSYSKSLTDTVIKILDINTEKSGIDANEVKRVRREFIHKLLERLNDDKSEVCYEYSLNIFQIFNELTFKRSFYEILIEDAVLDKLEVILKKESPECSTNASIRILNVLVSHLRDHLSMLQPQEITQNYTDDSDDVIINEDDTPSKEQSLSLEEQVSKHNLVEFIKSKVIDYLTSQLQKLPERTHLDFQYADNQAVLGKRRLACINLMESLVDLDDSSVRDKILETNFYEQLFDLFLQFRFNTFLQLHLDNIFHRILRGQNISNEYKVGFLKKLRIFERLPAYWTDNQNFKFPSQREFRYGYLAFTTRMANTLRDMSKSVPEIEQLVAGEEWKHFHEKDVEVYNEKNSIVLANRGGNRKDSDDFENMDDDDDQRFKDLDEREDLDDKEDEEEDEEDAWASRNSMRETLQAYDPSKARDEHEDMFVGENIEKDEEEDNLFSGLNSRKTEDDDSEEDKPIAGADHDEDSDSDSDSEDEKEDVSESSNYYDNSYWQISQYNIDDLLHG